MNYVWFTQIMFADNWREYDLLRIVKNNEKNIKI